jgi:lactoylglutathione lyase
MLTGAQTNLYCGDPERAAAFFASMGLTERFRHPPEGRPEHIEVALGDGYILGLTARAAIEGLAGLPAPEGGAQSEIVLWCGDVPAAYDRALAVGAAPLAAPRAFSGRLTAAWVEAPEGIRVKLVAPLGPV